MSSLTTLALLTLFLFQIRAQAKMVVHEWGTFTSLIGSNGLKQAGMYHEDEVLPDFVHNFGEKTPARFSSFATPIGSSHDPECQRTKIPCEFLQGQLITQKMETPVVYFYSSEPKSVSFDVGFPGGIISQSYPATSSSRPKAVPGVELRNGFAHYDVQILKNSSEKPPAVEADNIYSHARNVNSDLIKVGTEVEKFIFYRGLGDFATQLRTTSRDGRLMIQNLKSTEIKAAFLVFTKQTGEGSYLKLPVISGLDSIGISSKKISILKNSTQPQDEFIRDVRTSLTRALTSSGLYREEALAMVDTWEHGYFKTPGLRLLYILNPAEVEEILPIQLSPRPENLARVFVGRIEILLDTEENAILNAIEREGLRFDVRSLGRMAKPTLIRVREIARERGVNIESTIDALLSQAS